MPTCPTCQGQYAESELLGPDKREIDNIEALRPLPGKTLLCPRCEIDIYSWQPERDKMVPIVMKPFPLILPLLAVLLSITGQDPHWVGTVLAVILSLVAFLILSNRAPAFRISKWAKPFKAKPGPSLEMIELGAFVVGLGVGLVTLVLMKYWILPPAEPQFMEKLATSLAYSLFFVLITVALTGMMVNREVRKLDKIMPQPVFTNTTRLLNIVFDAAKEQLNPRPDLKIENVERTGDAGIQVAVSLKQKGSSARWRIKGDMWGRIRSIDAHDW